MTDFTISKGDLLPVIQANLIDSNGLKLNLSGGWTVKFYMATSPSTISTPVIDGVAATIVDAANGLVEYDWQGTDTDTPGTYVVRWKATNPAATKTESFPNGTFTNVIITENF